MAVTVSGNKINFGADNDSITLNCPIKKIMAATSATQLFNIVIDGNTFSVSVGNNRVIEFPSLNGYPGVTITAIKTCTLCILEIGDVLNPNYFKEDIRNWNGQGAAAVAETSETPAPAKATRSKKAEVAE